MSNPPLYGSSTINSVKNIQENKKESTLNSIQDAMYSVQFNQQQQQQQQNKPPFPSSSTTPNTKLHNIIKNFYIKAAQIIIQSRVTTGNGKVNKWFSLITTEMISLREELKFWFTQAIRPTLISIPPMIIYIYLDTSRFSLDQFLKSLTGASHSKNIKFYETHGKKIILESWLLSFKPPYQHDPSLDLPNLYKRSITFFRSLHSLTRLLSSSQLFHKNAPLGYRLATEINAYKNDEIPIDQPLMKNDNSKQTDIYKLSKVPTPIGTFQLNVYYRNYSALQSDNNKFTSVEPFELNEHCYLPPLTNIQNLHHHYQQQSKQHTLYRSQSSPLLQQNKKNMNHSKLFVQPSISPFKSPSLASTPIPFYSQKFVPTIEKSKSTTTKASSSSSSSSSSPLSSSLSTAYKPEFYSSFENYKSKNAMSKRNISQINYQKSRKDTIEKENDLEEFMRLVITKPDLKLFQDKKNDSLMIESTAWSPYSGTDSGFLGASKSVLMRTKLSLRHFQTLQHDHSELSESMATTLNSNESSTSYTSSSMSYSLAATGPATTAIVPSSSSSSSSSNFSSSSKLKKSMKMKSSDMMVALPTSTSTFLPPQTSISTPARSTQITSDISTLPSPIQLNQNNERASLSISPSSSTTLSSMRQKNKLANNNAENHQPLLCEPIMEILSENEVSSSTSTSNSSSSFEKYF
ncbi:autophagy-related protein 13-domain-containing protein [Cunninghamella echinulata]|nr:autophagy-related protein 13-domain-containing protein [Cunninghamella echinulata]